MFKKSTCLGFTLIELLVIITIIGILAMVGYASYSGIVSRANDVKRKVDLEAISKAYEVHYSDATGYLPLDDNWFASGKIPVPPEGGSYQGLITQPSFSGYQVCSTLIGGLIDCVSSRQLAYVSGSSTTPSVPAVGLVGFWKMDEGSGSSVADSSGNSHNGSLVSGATWTVSGKYGVGTSFDGISANKNKINLGDQAVFERTTATIAGWIYRKGNCGTYNACIIFSKGTSGWIGYALDVSAGSGTYKPSLNIKDQQRVYGTTTINTNQWYHIAASFNGSRIKVYVNGVLETDSAQNLAPTYAGESARIGNGNTNEDLPINGYLDEVGFWDRALSDSEIAGLCNCAPSSPVPLPSTSPAPSSSTPTPSSSPTSSSAPVANPITKKVLLVNYDPILSNGKKLHQDRGWGDPATLVPQIISSIQNSSGGYVNYQVVDTQNRNEWPRKMDGFRYNETTYNSCMSNHSTCHSPDDMDYNQLWSDLNICSQVSSGAIDEVFLYGAPYFGFDEFAFKIPGDVMPYNPPSNYWIYQGRKKNIPNCNGKTVFVMGWSYERGVAEALHSYGHRTESALVLTLGRGEWNACNGSSDFDHFSCVNMDVSGSTPVTVAGCGNVHFPPNGTSGYDYGNANSVNNACASWNNYPFTTKTVVNQNCNTWGCSQLGYLEWWLGNMPKKTGVNSSGNLNNWWKYIADFDNGVAEAKGVLGVSKRSSGQTVFEKVQDYLRKIDNKNINN